MTIVPPRPGLPCWTSCGAGSRHRQRWWLAALITALITALVALACVGAGQARDERPGSDVKGRNPFKDRRVRQAVAHAINAERDALIDAVRTEPDLTRRRARVGVALRGIRDDLPELRWVQLR